MQYPMNKQPHILFFIPVHRRPAITRLCFDGLERLRQRIGDHARTEVLIVGDEEEHRTEAKARGYKWCEAENNPVGAKFNTGMQHALTLPWTHVWQLNSDNLLSNDIWEAFEHLFMSDCPLFGIEWLYFYDSNTGRMKQHRYFTGCGIRVIRREAIESAGWCRYAKAKMSMAGGWINIPGGETGYFPKVKTQGKLFQELSAKDVFQLWPPNISNGLDNTSRNQIMWVLGLNTIRFPAPDKWPMPLVVDIKSETNIWSFEDFDDPELTPEQVAEAIRPFPELEKIRGARQPIHQSTARQ